MEPTLTLKISEYSALVRAARLLLQRERDRLYLAYEEPVELDWAALTIVEQHVEMWDATHGGPTQPSRSERKKGLYP